MDFKANCGVWGTMFGVPCIVADNFLKLATGEQIKVLLYILRSSGKSVSTEEISMNTGVPPQQVDEAVLFWRQVNVLMPDSPAVPNLMTAAPSQPAVIQSPASPSAPVSQLQPAAQPVQRQKQNLTPTEISDLLKTSPDVSELFKVSESALGSLNHTMQNSLIWMYNYLGLKKEVIITLLFYCVSIEKTNAAYIEKIAWSWSEKDINTLENAQEEVERMSGSHNYIETIMKLFEMKRKPTTKQLELIEQWRVAGYDDELIRYAYEKTIENIDKLNFDYINKILLSWKESGFTTVRDVNKAEDEFQRNKKKSAASSGSDDFDVEKYKILINNI